MNKENEYRFIARSGFVARTIAGDTVLVPIDTGNVYVRHDENLPPVELPMFNGMIQLNEVALFLWNSLSEPRSISELISLVEDEFDTQDFNVEADIIKFLEIGITNQLIFIVDTDAALDANE